MVINQKFFISGFQSLWHRAPNMDTLVALGATAAFGYSTYALFAMTGAQVRGDTDAVMAYMMDFYFESAAMILTLITVGKMLEARSKGKTTDALKSLMKLAPQTATVVRDGTGARGPHRAGAEGRRLRRPPGREHPRGRRGAGGHKRRQRGGADRREHPGGQGRGRHASPPRRSTSPASCAAAPRASARTPRSRRSSRWSATPPRPKRPSQRSPTGSPACSCRRSLRIAAGDDRRVAAARSEPSASRWRAAFPCSSSAAPARWGLPRRSPSWSAADWARRTAFCSKPPRRWRRRAAWRSSRWTRPAPSPQASRRSPSFFPADGVSGAGAAVARRSRSSRRASIRSPAPFWKGRKPTA